MVRWSSSFVADALQPPHKRNESHCRGRGENHLTQSLRVSIVGVGLIGGSLGMALRRVRVNGRRRFQVGGISRTKANLVRAKKLGAIDSFATNVGEELSQADIVVLCIPVHRIVPFIEKNLSRFRKGAIITDVGSVKGPIVVGMKQAARKRRDLQFVGGHPIAGSEKTGVENAQVDLFKKAVCVLTKDGATFTALDTLRSLWTSVGARCALMSAADHDKWLALTSHLPHLLAFSLFAQIEVLSKKSPTVRTLVGGSFRDMTRIAGADADLWTGVISHNRREIGRASTQFLKQLRFFSNTSATSLHKTLKHLARAKQNW